MNEIQNKRKPVYVEENIEPQRLKLVGTAEFWKSVINTYIELEIIPHIYIKYLHHTSPKSLPKKIRATNGTTAIYATIYEDKIILTKAVRLEKPILKEEAESKVYEWYRTTLSLWIDKNFYFLKDYQQKKFELDLIVPAYIKAKALMPSDRLAVNDGDSRVVIAKKDGSTLVLLTGMKQGDENWEGFRRISSNT